MLAQLGLLTLVELANWVFVSPLFKRTVGSLVLPLLSFDSQFNAWVTPVLTALLAVTLYFTSAVDLLPILWLLLVFCVWLYFSALLNTKTVSEVYGSINDFSVVSLGEYCAAAWKSSRAFRLRVLAHSLSTVQCVQHVIGSLACFLLCCCSCCGARRRASFLKPPTNVSFKVSRAQLPASLVLGGPLASASTSGASSAAPSFTQVVEWDAPRRPPRFCCCLGGGRGAVDEAVDSGSRLYELIVEEWDLPLASLSSSSFAFAFSDPQSPLARTHQQQQEEQQQEELRAKLLFAEPKSRTSIWVAGPSRPGPSARSDQHLRARSHFAHFVASCCCLTASFCAFCVCAHVLCAQGRTSSCRSHA
jgi:hypothetical protein